MGRTASHRQMMMRNMVTSLFENERVVTTEAKAKAVKPLAEKMITLAKRGDLHARRLALGILTKKSVTHKLFSEIKDRYMERAGGYASVVKLGPRKGDAAEMAVLQLIKPEDAVKPSKKKGKKKKGLAKKAAEQTRAAQKEEKPAKAEAQAPVAPEETAPAAAVEAAPGIEAETTPEVDNQAQVEAAPAEQAEETPVAEADTEAKADDDPKAESETEK